MNQETYELLTNVVEKLIRKYRRRCSWANPDDLRQEAWLELLGTKLDRLRPDTAERYVWRVASARMGRFLYKESSPVGGPMRHGREREFSFRAKPLSAEICAGLAAMSPTPEQEAIQHESLRLERELRQELRERVGDLGRSCVHLDAVLLVLLDGLPPEEAARRKRVRRDVVYREVGSVKRRAKCDRKVRAILTELEDRRRDL